MSCECSVNSTQSEEKLDRKFQVVIFSLSLSLILHFYHPVVKYSVPLATKYCLQKCRFTDMKNQNEPKVPSNANTCAVV